MKDNRHLYLGGICSPSNRLKSLGGSEFPENEYQKMLDKMKEDIEKVTKIEEIYISNKDCPDKIMATRISIQEEFLKKSFIWNYKNETK